MSDHSNSSSNSYHDDNEKINKNDQSFQIYDQNNSNTSLEISKLNIQEPVNEFAKRITSLFAQIQQFKANFEKNTLKSENEENCVKFCEELLQEHIRSLDRMNDCLNERNNLLVLLDEAQNKIKEMERLLWYEKEAKNDLKKKYEEDEQQNQEETIKKEKLINILQTKLKKLECERKQIYNEKQDLFIQYQNDLTKHEKERIHLQKLNKKLENDKEFDEIQSLNHKNDLINLTYELCVLFNLASEYRRKPAFFGKQFLDAFELVFEKLKINSSNVTFLQTLNNCTNFDLSGLNLQDITFDELNNFNIILKEKLKLNEDETTIDERTFIDNSEIMILNNVNNFENRLLGNETFKLASLSEGKKFIPSSFVEIVANDIMDELITEEIRYLIIKTLIETNSSKLSLQNGACKDQIKFMLKPDGLIFDESFQEEIYNRFEESFSQHLTRDYRLNNCPEVLLDILYNKDENKNEVLVNHLQHQDSKISLATMFPKEDGVSNKTNIKTIIQSSPIKSFSSMNINSTSDQLVENNYQNKSEIRSMVKSKKKSIDSNASTLTSNSRSNSMSNYETGTATELIVTLNNKDYNSESEESSKDSNIIEPPFLNSFENFDSHSMQLTNINNLSSVFNELSSNLKLNSTVKTDEKCASNSMKLNNSIMPKNSYSSTTSSNMRLSEDMDYFEENSNECKEIDLMLVDIMLSKDKRSHDLDNFYTTIRQESDHNITNMDVTNSTESFKFISSPPTVHKFGSDKYVSNENLDLLHDSSPKCTLRKRNRKFIFSPYLSPILSLLSFFYPLFLACKYTFVIVIFFLGFCIYFLCHFHALKIYYTSWQDIGLFFLNLYTN